jgi:peptidoglycan/xylan/chitin deacetylase (PgdA/CDA1 family)
MAMDETRNLIGVVCRQGEEPCVREFFELFKTPWEFYRSDSSYSVVISTQLDLRDVRTKLLVFYGADSDIDVDAKGGIEVQRTPFRVVRAGYNIFGETRRLLSVGQPAAKAATPILDVYIWSLRNWIQSTGISLFEIPPTPRGYDFMASLTHDVDFIRLRDHTFDHTMWGFVRRASIDSLRLALKHEMPWSHVRCNLRTLVSLPAIHLGFCRDPWLEDFDRYLKIERDTKSTYFFIPFRNRPGENVDRPHATRRAAAYDIANEELLLRRLEDAGHEIGVHGIDAWHSTEAGREERRKVAELTGDPPRGIRMHWLCWDDSSARKVEQAGFAYDSTFGYNDTVGFRSGTLQAFQPPGATTLLEVPLHIQDTALFYPRGQSASPDGAWEACEAVIRNAARYGGALTILWHTRSLAPERLWGPFYLRLLGELESHRVWFGTAGQIAEWFRKRRAVSLEGVDSTDANRRIAAA